MAYIKFWGVRGSIPTPGPSTVRYGGNTPCVELRISDDKFFILDAGSGIRELGNELLKLGKPVKSHIFLSHMHWDHIQGIPFFVPAYIPGNDFTFYGAQDTDLSIDEILKEQMNPVNFPIQMQQMGSSYKFKGLYEGLYTIDGINMETFYLNHPGYALGYKFQIDGKSVVYISDNEPYPEVTDDDGEIIEDQNQKLVNFVKDVDYLIHDAQYTPEEYNTKIKWGHSSYDFTTKIALQGKVKNLVIFHHDPMHDDDFVDSIVDKSKEIAGDALTVIGAYEGLKIDID